jgi:hypothetical protein
MGRQVPSTGVFCFAEYAGKSYEDCSKTGNTKMKNIIIVEKKLQKEKEEKRRGLA